MSQKKDDAEEVSPRYKHARKIASEAREFKSPQKVISEEIETVYDTRGRAKRRRVITLANGNKHRVFINEKKEA